jgi:hypothetical protein
MLGFDLAAQSFASMRSMSVERHAAEAAQERLQRPLGRVERAVLARLVLGQEPLGVLAARHRAPRSLAVTLPGARPRAPRVGVAVGGAELLEVPTQTRSSVAVDAHAVGDRAVARLVLSDHPPLLSM